MALYQIQASTSGVYCSWVSEHALNQYLCSHQSIKRNIIKQPIRKLRFRLSAMNAKSTKARELMAIEIFTTLLSVIDVTSCIYCSDHVSNCLISLVESVLTIETFFTRSHLKHLG